MTDLAKDLSKKLKECGFISFKDGHWVRSMNHICYCKPAWDVEAEKIIKSSVADEVREHFSKIPLPSVYSI